MSGNQTGQNLLLLGAGIVIGGLSYCLFNRIYYKMRFKNNISKGIIYMIDENININIFDNANIYKSLIRLISEDTTIKLIITTYGGNYSKCFEILHYLKQHKAGYIVYINKQCQSAGTFLALGAKEIVMDNYSNISKIDCQHDGYSTIYYEKMFLETKENLDGKDILKSYHSINWVNYLIEELKKIVSDDLYSKIKDELICSNLPHGKCYYYNDCVKLGLSIRKPVEEELIYFND